VRDLDPEGVLELHDQLDQVERVGVEVLLEGRLLRDLALLDPELLGQNLLDPLEDFIARRCHLTSTCVVYSGARRSYTGDRAWEPVLQRVATRSGSCSESRLTTSCSTPRAASRIAFAIARLDEFPCAITTSPRSPSR